ncbi:LuxR C-terminal-related transcriptional regulator [Sneathiella chinensis]|uniref:DNA-binding response regulator n=1 Tax=Sneathiella chinensis TaxID=349750 RepID=A0ABQ5U7B9_9PROT|nr:response regulator transcription factor [Sneathiella chinensis]GLQ07799.1 DNA-binding response regulator [Sneathiella chinensis]
MKILIADDHPLYRMALCGLLEQLDENANIIDCNDFTELREEMYKDGPKPDLVILDIKMPGPKFDDVLTGLKKDFPDIPVVIVSASEELPDMSNALKLGADGYIPKSSSREILLSAIRLVLSGGKYIPSQAFTLSTSSPEKTKKTTPQPSSGKATSGTDSLTRRQRNVLDLMAQGRSNREIAEALNLAESTVKVHITAIFRTLGVSNRTQAVLQAKELV